MFSVLVPMIAALPSWKHALPTHSPAVPADCGREPPRPFWQFRLTLWSSGTKGPGRVLKRLGVHFLNSRESL